MEEEGCNIPACGAETSPGEDTITSKTAVPVQGPAADRARNRLHHRAGGMEMQILMVITAADRLKLRDGTIKRTGYWAEEVAVPHEMFRSVGVTVPIATPAGRKPPVDEASLNPGERSGPPAIVRHYKDYLDSIADLRHPMVLEELAESRLEEYDAIFLPGGHGPLADLVCSGELGDMVRRMQVDGKLVVAVCHGPAGLLPAVTEDGRWAFAGYRLTGFTNEEEQQVGLANKLPFLLENRLRELGADYQPGRAWEPHVIIDRNLITGQNPASSAGVAQETLARLGVGAAS